MATDGPTLERVLWMGGGSGGGKSTLAKRLASDHDLALYQSDLEMSAHARLLEPNEAPLLHDFMAMDMDERWVHRSPQVMFDTFHWFHGEGFDRLIADVRTLANGTAGGRLIVEGLHLLPRLVAPLLEDRQHAIWLLPTPKFRARVFARRRAIGSHFVDRTGDPDQAMANLLHRDRLFTEQLRAEVKSLGLVSVDVDGARSIDDMAAGLAVQFGLR